MAVSSSSSSSLDSSSSSSIDSSSSSSSIDSSSSSSIDSSSSSSIDSSSSSSGPFVDPNVSNTALLWHFINTRPDVPEIEDSSPLDNDGTLINGPTFIPATESVNAHFNFDGVDQGIGVDGLVTDVASDTVGSFFAWVRLASDNNAQNGIIVMLPSSGASSSMLMEFDMRGSDNNARVKIQKDGVPLWENRSAVGSIVPLIGEWTHIGVVQDGTGPVLYLNVELVVSTPTTTTDPTAWVKSIATDAST